MLNQYDIRPRRLSPRIKVSLSPGVDLVVRLTVPRTGARTEARRDRAQAPLRALKNRTFNRVSSVSPFNPVERPRSPLASLLYRIGAHPDHTWSKKIGTNTETKYINWLVEKDMLPSCTPNARILRDGYESSWFGQQAMRTSVSVVADHFLLAPRRMRKVPN